MLDLQARVCSLLKRSKAACRWFLPRWFISKYYQGPQSGDIPDFLLLQNHCDIPFFKKGCLSPELQFKKPMLSASQHVLVIRWRQGANSPTTIIDPSNPPCQGVMRQQIMYSLCAGMLILVFSTILLPGSKHFPLICTCSILVFCSCVISCVVIGWAMNKHLGWLFDIGDKNKPWNKDPY